MLEKSKAFSGYSVKDTEKARQFYGDILGLKTSMNRMGILELLFESGVRLVLYPKPNHEPATYTVLNFPVADIDAAVVGLTAKGVDFLKYGPPINTDEKGICRSPDADHGPHIAWFKDPSGNILSVMEEVK